MDLDSAQALEPPRDETPVPVVVEQPLTGSAEGRMSVQSVLAHSTGLLLGFRVDLAERPRHGSRTESDLRALFLGQPVDTGPLLGFRYADGQWRSTIPGQPRHLTAGAATARMSLVRAGNRGPVVEAVYWCWPSTDGDLVLFGAWPSHGMEFADRVVPGNDIAAARMRVTR